MRGWRQRFAKPKGLGTTLPAASAEEGWNGSLSASVRWNGSGVPACGTHSLYTSPRNGPGTITGNRFTQIGRDAIQVGHATRVRVDGNSGSRIGYPAR